MGLKLRVSLFRDAAAADVRAAMLRFWRGRGAELAPAGERHQSYVLHEASRGFCTLEWDGGWEWRERREAHAAAAAALGCPALFVFVYDGNYWGYELVDARGSAVDQFVQEDVELTGEDWFPNRDTRGDAGILARTLRVPEQDVAPYLRQITAAGAEDRELDLSPVRPGDRHGREDESAVLDFFGALGVDVSLAGAQVVFGGDIAAQWSVTRDGRWVGRHR